MVADVARARARWSRSTPRTRSAPAGFTVLRRVVLPHSYPGIIDVARINLAAAWLMLVVGRAARPPGGARLPSSSEAQRFRQYDRMFGAPHRVRR